MVISIKFDRRTS